MSDLLKYKGYATRVEYDAKSKMLIGQLEGIRDCIVFEANNLDDFEAYFRESVDDYLAACAELGREPQKAYSGSFNVRIPPELHRKTVELAMANGTTMNAEIIKALDAYVLRLESA